MSTVGKGRVGRRQFHQAHLAPTQSQRQPKTVRVVKRRDTHRASQTGQALQTHVIQYLDGDQVIAGGQGLSQQHRSVPAPVIVPGHIGVALARDKGRAHVNHHRGRGERTGVVGVKRSGVGDGLDRGSGLAGSGRTVEGPVDARVKVVRAADHRQHLAGVRVDHHHSRVAHVAGGETRTRIGQLRQPVAHDPPRRVLRIQVKRGVDVETLRVDRLQAKLALQLTPHEHHKMGRFDRKGDRGKAQLLPRCQFRLLMGDHAVFGHQTQHYALPGPGGIEILQRVVTGRRLRKPGQERALGQVKLSGTLGKVGARSSLNAISQVAIVGLV